ncbi:MAG: ATPase [Candidatus Melainabacteria bacterium]|jgi:hypothetical protein
MSNIKLFESKKVRSHWSEGEQKWYFSIIDVVEVLTDSNNPRRYWSDLKRKLEAEGSELYEKIVQLKLETLDGKLRETDLGLRNYIGTNCPKVPTSPRKGDKK